jgi:hypothetical protein
MSADPHCPRSDSASSCVICTYEQRMQNSLHQDEASFSRENGVDMQPRSMGNCDICVVEKEHRLEVNQARFPCEYCKRSVCEDCMGVACSGCMRRFCVACAANRTCDSCRLDFCVFCVGKITPADKTKKTTRQCFHCFYRTNGVQVRYSESRVRELMQNSSPVRA